jgi:hypothetical protein
MADRWTGFFSTIKLSRHRLRVRLGHQSYLLSETRMNAVAPSAIRRSLWI